LTGAGIFSWFVISYQKGEFFMTDFVVFGLIALVVLALFLPAVSNRPPKTGP
jgi:hypothetical protein